MLAYKQTLFMVNVIRKVIVIWAAHCCVIVLCIDLLETPPLRDFYIMTLVVVAPWQSWIFCFWLSLPKLHYWPPSWIHSITPLSRGIVRTLLSAIYSLLLHFGPFCEARVSEEIATVNSGSEILEVLCQKNVKYWFVLPCTI